MNSPHGCAMVNTDMPTAIDQAKHKMKINIEVDQIM